MTVKDVLEKSICTERCTPILVYNNAHKNHMEFEYGEFLDGKVHPNYLNEEVDNYEQFEQHGVINIILK